MVSPDDPFRPNPLARAQEPSGRHWLGTDFIGRDVLSRIIHGTKWSLFVAVTSVLLGTTLGAVWAVASAFFGGTFDLLGQRLGEVLLSFPPILLALLLASALGASTFTVILSRSPPPGSAYGMRIIRSQALVVKEIQYVEAARSLGSSSWRIIFRHIAPQCIGPYLILITTSLGIAIVLEATLGFLGAGIPPPTPTWGNMLGDAASMLIPKWHLVVFPGLAIVIAALAFNQFGDGLRDALDPAAPRHQPLAIAVPEPRRRPDRLSGREAPIQSGERARWSGTGARAPRKRRDDEWRPRPGHIASASRRSRCPL